MIKPEMWMEECDQIELMSLQQRMQDIAALLVAFKQSGDERLLELAITLTGEYDE